MFSQRLFNSPQNVLRRLILFLALIVVFSIEADNVRAKSSVTIPGSSWSARGIFRVQGHGGTTQLSGVADLFFGPQTVTTQAGPVLLATDEFVLLLSDELNESVVFGAYTPSEKGKLKNLNLQPAHESLRQKLIGLLEATYDAEYGGIIDVANLQLKAAVKSNKKQQTVQITLQGNALFVGHLDGTATDLDITFSYSSAGRSDVSGIQNLGCGGAEYPAQVTSPYVLPYEVGEGFLMNQGNCAPGRGYHSIYRGNTRAYDFLMPIGTTITAARSGTVIRAQAANDAAGNFVAIRHEDRTVAWYMHIRTWLVAEGQIVSQGQPIATSGASGTTGGIPGPHLHFDVTACSNPGSHCGVTIPVTFRNALPHPFGLEEGIVYTAFPY